MKYTMSVKKFLETDIDYIDFISQVQEEVVLLNKQFNFLNNIGDLTKRISVEHPLKGLPISVKDNICVKGMQSAAGSRILEGYKPPFDATSVSRFKQAGGRILGKTNQDEFGFGTFSINSGYSIPKNPLDSSRSCGGSSGGAAGLTAALRYPHIALAESTGGSISCPAAFCGVVGLTPTYGLVSRYGLIDYANSLDKIGIISKCVWDAALGLSIISGHDERDQTSLLQHEYDYTKHAVSKDLANVKIAIPKEYLDVDETIEKSFWQAIKKLEDLGAKYKEVSLPYTKMALPSYYIIATSEASTNLARYCGLRYGLDVDTATSKATDVTNANENFMMNFNNYFSIVRSKGFGPEAKRRIILGTFARMSGYRKAYYLKAMQVRTLVVNDFKRILKSHDCIAAPTMPILPPKFTDIEKLTPMQHYQSDVLTVPVNLAGMPHISVPCGRMIGLHLIGDHLQEGRIIEIASAFESVEAVK